MRAKVSNESENYFLFVLTLFYPALRKIVPTY